MNTGAFCDEFVAERVPTRGIPTAVKVGFVVGLAPVSSLVLLSLILLVGCQPQQRRPRPDPVYKGPTSAQRAVYAQGFKVATNAMLQGSYSQAAKSFETLMINYSGTDLGHEANDWYARCLMGLGQYAEAFNRYKKNQGDGVSAVLRARSQEAMAQASFHLQNYQGALSLYSGLMVPMAKNGLAIDQERAIYFMYACHKALGNELDMSRMRARLQSRFPKGRFLHRLIKGLPASGIGIINSGTASTGSLNTIKKPVAKPYYIQCGIFSSPANAQQMLSRLKWKGFEPIQVAHPGEGQMLLIILGYYKTQDLAESQLRRLMAAGFQGIVKP